MPFPLFLAAKYMKPKRSVASAITVVSILGVMLGVASVVVVRSVMTGFGDEWRKKILEFKPHVSIMAHGGRLVPGERGRAAAARSIPGVRCATPEVDSRILLSAGGRVSAPVLLGIGENDFRDSYDVGRPVAGDFDLEPETVVLGLELARSLGVWAGDTVTVCAPPLPDEVHLPRKWRVSGIFSSGHYDYDTGYVIAGLDSSRDLLGIDEGVVAIHIKTSCPLDASRFDAVVAALKAQNPGLRAVTWREADRRLFDAIAVETNMTAILLLLVSVVALFCVMNTLLVIAVQKTPEIGLLRALGFGRAKISLVFLVHGLAQCTAGVVLGLLASWGILSNLQRIVDWLGHLGVAVFPPDIYHLSEIPHRVVPADVVYAVAAIYAFGLLASLVPALVAASKDPVKALNGQ